MIRLKKFFLYMLFIQIFAISLLVCNCTSIDMPKPNIEDYYGSVNAPTMVYASHGTEPDVINVSWRPAIHADYYRVHRADSIVGDYTEIADNITSSSFVDTITGTRYYKIQACTDQGEESGLSSISAKGWTGSAPDAPSLNEVVYNDVDECFSITWGDVTGEDSYIIYKSRFPDGIYYEINRDTVIGTEYKDYDISSDVRYYYRVTAVSGNDESEYSNREVGHHDSGDVTNEEFLDIYQYLADYVFIKKMGLTLPPYTLYGEYDDESGGRVDVTMDQDNMIIYYSFANYCDDGHILNGNLSANLNQELGGNMTGTISVTGLNNGTMEYHVIIENLYQTDGYYNVNSEEDLIFPTRVPEIITADGIFEGITVQWGESIGADYFILYRSNTVDGTYGEITTIDSYGVAGVGGMYNDGDEPIPSGTCYYYKVRAYREKDGGDVPGNFSIYSYGCAN